MNDVIKLPLHVDTLLADYALGGCSSAERAEVERHLGSCPRCVRELADIADTFALLAEAEVACQLAAPSTLKHRLLESVEPMRAIASAEWSGVRT